MRFEFVLELEPNIFHRVCAVEQIEDKVFLLVEAIILQTDRVLSRRRKSCLHSAVRRFANQAEPAAGPACDVPPGCSTVR